MSAAQGNQPARFGELLSRQRAAAGLTQEALAERAGLSVRGLRYLEKGLRRPYRDTVEHLVEALALSPEDHNTLIAAARPGSAPSQAGDGRGSNVPVPPSPAIGRERDVATVVGLMLRQDVRVLTLTGPGGVGKTRLALEVAARLEPALSRVVWVPLATLTDSGLVPSAIAQALGLTETGALSLQEALSVSLHDRQVLLLLDNFEHVAAAGAMVSDLVERSPRLKVLVTSRAALRLRSEHEFAVSPLTPPPVAPQISVYALAANPAVDLFLRRAQAVKPDFSLTQANGAAVAEICRRLDGLPLALELAAPRIRVLPARAMLVRLEHRLSFLTGGARDLPARQRTMRATLVWSHDLLSAAEQALFRQLAVFNGGCTLSAAEELCARTGDTSMDLLDGIEALHRNSLLRLDGTTQEEPRFRMLETIREYGLERLAASGEEEDLRRRHAGYYLAFAEEAARGCYSPATASWLDRLESDHDNLRAALRWCIEQEDADMGLRLVAALWWFWYVRGHVTEGRTLLATLLSSPHAAPPSASRAEALLGAGQLALTQGDYPAAWASLETSTALFRGLGDRRGTASALLAAGFVARLQEQYPTAKTMLEEGLALARATRDTFIVAATLHHLGMIAADAEQDLTAARRLLEESLAHYRSLGFPRFIALVLLSLGEVSLAEGSPACAQELLQQSLTGMREVGENLGIPGALDTMAHLAITQGHIERAVRLAAAAERLRAATGTHSWPVVERTRTQWLPPARETVGEKAFGAAWARGEAMTAEQAIAYALNETGPEDR